MTGSLGEAAPSSLESLFTDVIVYDANGVVSFDIEKAEALLGAEQAAQLAQQLQAARSTGSTPAAQSGMTTMAAGQDFVNCMVEGSVLGLIGGIASGSFAELIRKKAWDELAQKLLPRLVKAGVTGGVVGIVAGLAASAVQCSFFD